jgi:ABC-type lipoprotein release transport system permease subunit
MMSYPKIAWRNIWRNKRRTLITTASVFFGVLLSCFMTSMQEGSYAQYIQAIVNSYSGYLQIHQKGYWDDKIINNTFEMTPAIASAIGSVREVTIFTPRLETYALASTEEITKGVMVIGVDPVKEDKITNISGKVVWGRYLVSDANGVLLGERLARYLKLRPNDTLVLIGQGYHGVSAAGKYPVAGIIRHPAPEFDRNAVYMGIGACQELFSADSRLTSAVIMVHDNDEVAAAKSELQQRLGGSMEVMDWKEINRLLLKQIESDRAGGVIMKGILYMIIGFGILGTIMMMMAERRREFGIMMAIGMQKYKLVVTLMLETFYIGMIGVVAGIVASIPVIYYFLFNPIPLTGQAGEMMVEMGFAPAMFFSSEPFIFWQQAITVFILTIAIGMYPMVNFWRLRTIGALRG